MEYISHVDVRENIGCHFLPALGVVGGVLVMWKEELIRSRNVKVEEVTISCSFENVSNRESWCFTSVYCKGK